MMLGDLLAEDLKKQPGDTLEIQGTPFKVVGDLPWRLRRWRLARSSCHSTSYSSSAACRAKFRRFMCGCAPRPPEKRRNEYMKHAQAQIEAALPGLRAVPAAERASNNQFVRMAQASAWGTSSIALLIGILGIANTMAMSVFERTREIGILRALGWKRRQVLVLIQLEAVVLGLGGGFVGIALGWCALHVLAVLPQTASIVSSSFPWELSAEALGIAVLAGLIAGALPAWRGAQTFSGGGAAA